MGARILIVDDEDNHRKSLSIGLRLEGFEVVEAGDGEQALDLLERDAGVDVAIVDLMMPGINGLDLAKRLRFRRPEMKVLLTSAYHLNEEQLERADVGAIGFVPKPYHLDELVQFLKTRLDGGAALHAP
jgi:DNA-binding response OmpR family regulator